MTRRSGAAKALVEQQVSCRPRRRLRDGIGFPDGQQHDHLAHHVPACLRPVLGLPQRDGHVGGQGEALDGFAAARCPDCRDITRPRRGPCALPGAAA